MKKIIIFSFLLMSFQSHAFECKKLLATPLKNSMDYDTVAAALKRNYGVSIIDVENTVRVVKGYWSLSEKIILAKDDSDLPQEVILAHELTHLRTDWKIEKDPSLKNLARGIMFEALNDGQSLNANLKNSSLPSNYEHFFAIDEPHALTKHIRVSEAIARKIHAEGDLQATRFLRNNPRHRGHILQFLTSSKVLLQQSLDFLETVDKDIEIYYERKPQIRKDSNMKLPSIDHVGELFFVQVQVPSRAGLPDILVNFSLYWRGNHEDIPSHSVPYLIKILKTALSENAQLIEQSKDMRLLSNRDLLN